MTSTPTRARCPIADENCTPSPSQNNRAGEPWSKSKTGRFGGYGSHYSQMPEAPLKERAPEQQTAVPSAPVNGRYATPRERLDTPTKQAPCHTMLSATDRFAMPGSHYKQNEVPGVGSYEPKVQEKKVRGATKLQAMVRRRQSRGIFRDAIQRSQEIPDMFKYADAKKSAMADATAAGHELPGNRSAAPRFNSKASSNPAVGDYNPQGPDDISKSRSLQKPSAVFQASGNRFNSHDSHFAAPEAPDAGAYQTHKSLAERSARSSKQTAAFANNTHRFDGHESHFRRSEAPGVGAYDTAALTSKEQASKSKTSSTMASTTNRFNSHDSHFKQSQAPGVGMYTPRDDVHIKGATKLQRSIRRRQSRGVFASVEARAKNMPDMYSYADAKPAAMAEATSKGNEAPAMRSAGSRFNGPGSHFHKQDVPEAGDYNPQRPADVAVSRSLQKPSAIFQAAANRFQSHDSHFTAPEAPGVGTYQTHESLAERSARSSKQTAAFANNTHRFDGHESHFRRSEAPGVGAYDTAALTSKEQASKSKTSSTMASTTNRFNSHDSHFKQSQAPGVGMYTPRDDVHIKGATKLQRSIRRRQSRGIFASVEARAKNMPDMYSYADAKPAAMAEATSKGNEAPAMRSAGSRFNGPGSHFHQQDVPEAGDYNPQNPLFVPIGKAVASASSRSSAATLSRVPRFEGQGSIYGSGSAASGNGQVLDPFRAAGKAIRSISRARKGATGDGSAASRLLSTASVLERLSIGTFDERAPLGPQSVLEEAPPQSQPKQQAFATFKPTPMQHVDSFELAEAEAEAFAALQVAVDTAPVDLTPVTEEEENAEEKAQEKAQDGSASEVVAQEQNTSAEVAEAKEKVPSEESLAEGDRLFKMLQANSTAEINRLDYFDTKDGWDFNGLRSDLQIETHTPMLSSEKL